MKSPWRTFPLPKPLTLLLEALAFAVAVASKYPTASPLGAVAVASRYPKASALGLSRPYKERGFSPRGMLSSLSHNFQWAKEQ
jgi:hypothetical protein